MENGTIKCADCHYDLSEIKSENIIPCPNCGSQRRILEASIHEGFKIYDSLRGEAKNPNYTGKRKWRWDSFSGWEKHHFLGKLVKKERLIDKDRNLYKEYAIDPDTNEILQPCRNT